MSTSVKFIVVLKKNQCNYEIKNLLISYRSIIPIFFLPKSKLEKVINLL